MLLEAGSLHPMRSARLLIWMMILTAGACGSPGLDEDALVLVVSSDLAVGPNRVAVGALNAENESVVHPDLDVGFEFFRPDGTPAGKAEAEFIWAIPDVRGLWVASFDFDVAGAWQVGVRNGDGNLAVSPPFNVALEAAAVDVGEPAPRSVSKTTGDGSLAEITTDTSPDPALYDQTVADAVTSGLPSVIVFATPAFCVSATCAPSLDTVKSLTGEFEDVNFVHVEVFDNLDAPSRDQLVLAPPVAEWGLQTEPWVFVVDEDGIVRARFEGAIGEHELRRALDAVT